MRKKGGVVVWVFLVFVCLAVAVIMLVIFLHGRSEPVVVPLNVSGNITYFNITVSSNALSNINYVLFNDSALLVSGVLFPRFFEEFHGVPENSSVNLSGWSNEYYFNATACNITRNKMDCRVGLKLKALDYSLSLSSSELVVDAGNASVQLPIICWDEETNVVNVLMDLPNAPVPTNLSKVVDFCYFVGHDITGRVIFPIIIRKNIFRNESDILRVIVRDAEIMGKNNIGDKSVGVIV
jgi:hypothetical protein